MYGKSPVEFPRRIVCLTAEHVEICFALGRGRPRGRRARHRAAAGGGARQAAGRRLHDASGRQDPGARARPRARVLRSPGATSCAELIGAGAAACSAPTSARSTRSCATILMVGGAARAASRRRATSSLDMRDEIRQVREFSSVWPDRPRVYFEEWHGPADRGHPLGLGAHRDRRRPRRLRRAPRPERARASGSSTPPRSSRRDPQIILASWCGKPVDLRGHRGRARAGTRISAVAAGQIHEMDGRRHPGSGPLAAARAPADPRDHPARLSGAR